MKSVFITGANQGIGFETAKELAKLGYYIFIGSRTDEKGFQAIEKLKLEGLHNVEYINIDVTLPHSIQLAKKELELKISGLDILINNAGIAGEQPQNMSSVDLLNLKTVFETNFFGAVQTTQQLIDLLKKSPHPRIVNVSSQLASFAIQSSSQNPNHRIYDAYSCSKTALNAFTLLFSREFENTNLKINSVEPGYTATHLNDYKGFQTPQEAAKVIVKYATLDDNGPTGKFFNKEGEMAW
ncbi:SDR family oxidoreductase [Chryseobacterium nematophagum]|uniref:SDR family oxidoreductase n=1 Tax=Chryseobacterium nematophagum TaxID=2305228 RepID=A0A3M7TG82_9FLAO|nr:SDR family oxidoreductase [Chryseobacterium nematophagum]RNA61986.1 SDR family oxidoreductase [Chryseobacterium nematophagum]